MQRGCREVSGVVNGVQRFRKKHVFSRNWRKSHFWIFGVFFDVDDDGDGVSDEIHSYTNTYDSSGDLDLVEAEVDGDGDGVTDYTSTTTYTYDSSGDVSEEEVEYDSDMDGVCDDMDDCLRW